MRPFGHRDPGIAGAALAREDLTVQLIVDGQHLADETVRLVWLAAAGRVALVSDAVGTHLGDSSSRCATASRTASTACSPGASGR